MSSKDQTENPPPRTARRWWIGSAIVVVLSLGGWAAYTWRDQPTRSDAWPTESPADAADPGNSFLDAFAEKAAPEKDTAAPALDNMALEERFNDLLQMRNEMQAMEEQFRQAGPAAGADLKGAQKARDWLVGEYSKGLATFEQDVSRARTARPNDGIPAWLTGELLKLVGGDPEAVMQHLRRALDAGLVKPRVLNSLCRTQIETNQFEAAYVTAKQALALDRQDRYAWDAFLRAAFTTERYAEVIARLDQAFPTRKPDWVERDRAEAASRLARWEAEQKRHAAEKQADDLPRVRLLIEHRRFARDAQGTPTTIIESTGRGEVVLELFEDQAPNTVANFLSLVAQKKYDRTRFYRVESASMAEGGDVKSRDRDAAEDGTGSPGYFIADEFERPEARPHFRGTISMVNNGPDTAGSRFFITTVPIPEMDGAYTAFGRVIAGQDVVDQITRGRTNRQVAGHGRIIPGDLLVRAEIVRKRAHEYRVTKVAP